MKYGNKLKIMIDSCHKIIEDTFILVKDYNLKQDIETIHYEKTQRIDNVVNEERVSKLDFDSRILRFIDVIKENIDDKNLDILYNNINSLKIENSSYKKDYSEIAFTLGVIGLITTFTSINHSII